MISLNQGGDVILARRSVNYPSLCSRYVLAAATTARLREYQLAYLLRSTLIFGGIVFLCFLARMRYLALSFTKLLRLGRRLIRPLLGRHIRTDRKERCRQGGIRRGDMAKF